MYPLKALRKNPPLPLSFWWLPAIIRHNFIHCILVHTAIFPLCVCVCVPSLFPYMGTHPFAQALYDIIMMSFMCKDPVSQIGHKLLSEYELGRREHYLTQYTQFQKYNNKFSPSFFWQSILLVLSCGKLFPRISHFPLWKMLEMWSGCKYYMVN